MKKLVLAALAVAAFTAAASASPAATPGAAVEKSTAVEWCNPYSDNGR